jgi:predicted deacetylase
MCTHYLLRLDDACESMNHKKWNQIEILLDSYGIKPMVSVIPNNKDKSQIFDTSDDEFWTSLKKMEAKGWEICMHGNTHFYRSVSGGINPVQKRSEFAEIPLVTQCEAIREGISKFKKMGFNPRIFVAPSHTFDKNTLLALESESEIRIISDTISLNPYRKYGFVFIPQQMNIVRSINLPGIFTFCYHPSVMIDSDFIRLELFLKTNALRFLSFEDINIENLKSKNIADKLYSFLYFQHRKIIKRA